ncbi:hypothetical protein ARZXY2_4780 (plasmid) [Arthrobacter sp. ZXY-2]|uniref:hypothetical protein n=1 Tax=Paenarthrobacter ureafaciens TaxID=37931 RepID=UPI0008A6BA74|nr:hypothetical protein ARZXY2_4780 [Arthrobacter sp. ZXY-2]
MKKRHGDVSRTELWGRWSEDSLRAGVENPDVREGRIDAVSAASFYQFDDLKEK